MEDSPASDISFREGGFVWKSWVEQPIRSLFHYIMAHPHDPACVNIIYPYDITVHLQLYVYILLYSWTSVCSMLLISSRESSFWFVLPAFFGWQCITTIITSQITWRSYIGSACPRHRWVCPKIGYIPQNPMILKLPQERFNLWCQAPATARWLWSSKKKKNIYWHCSIPFNHQHGFWTEPHNEMPTCSSDMGRKLRMTLARKPLGGSVVSLMPFCSTGTGKYAAGLASRNVSHVLCLAVQTGATNMNQDGLW